jgi:hypothetical protein
MSDNRYPLPLDLAVVRSRAKETWKREQMIRGGILDTIAQTVPWWVVIIGTGMMALSMAHTAGVFNQLSPVGYAGPFVVEFALLWAAFSRVASRAGEGGLSRSLRILETLAFIVALIVNAVGALDRVSAVSGIDTLSFEAITRQFGALPIRTQAAIIVIPLFALFIPIGTLVAGEGIAGLLMRGRKSSDKLEAQWNEVERGVLYRAFFEAYVQAGLKPGEARRQATLTANGFVEAKTSRDTTVTGSDSSDRNRDRSLSKRDEARRLLADNPDLHGLSLRQLEAQTGIDRQSWAVVKSENNHNGNGPTPDGEE